MRDIIGNSHGDAEARSVKRISNDTLPIQTSSEDWLWNRKQQASFETPCPRASVRDIIGNSHGDAEARSVKRISNDTLPIQTSSEDWLWNRKQQASFETPCPRASVRDIIGNSHGDAETRSVKGISNDTLPIRTSSANRLWNRKQQASFETPCPRASVRDIIGNSHGDAETRSVKGISNDTLPIRTSSANRLWNRKQQVSFETPCPHASVRDIIGNSHGDAEARSVKRISNDTLPIQTSSEDWLWNRKQQASFETPCPRASVRDIIGNSHGDAETRSVKGISNDTLPI